MAQWTDRSEPSERENMRWEMKARWNRGQIFPYRPLPRLMASNFVRHVFKKKVIFSPCLIYVFKQQSLWNKFQISYKIIFFEIIVQSAVFLVTELLLPLMDISSSCKRKQNCSSFKAYIRNDSKMWLSDNQFKGKWRRILFVCFYATISFAHYILILLS